MTRCAPTSSALLCLHLVVSCALGCAKSSAGSVAPEDLAGDAAANPSGSDAHGADAGGALETNADAGNDGNNGPRLDAASSERADSATAMTANRDAATTADPAAASSATTAAGTTPSLGTTPSGAPAAASGTPVASGTPPASSSTPDSNSTPASGSTPDSSSTPASGPTPDPSTTPDSSSAPEAGATPGASSTPDSGAPESAPATNSTADSGSVPAPDASDAGIVSSDPCEPGDGMQVPAAAATISGNGVVEFDTQPANQFLRMRTKLTVPPKPAPSGVIFLAAALRPQTQGANYSPIGNGALAPIVTWGPSCAPGSLSDYASWWASAQYVNSPGSESGYMGCQGGPVMGVAQADTLAIDVALSGSTWTQTIVDEQTGKTVDFAIDMKGQQQSRAIFDLELPTTTKPTGDVIYTSTILTMASADPAACVPARKGTNDYVTQARVSKDGLTCCIDRITLRASGVAATTTP